MFIQTATNEVQINKAGLRGDEVQINKAGLRGDHTQQLM